MHKDAARQHGFGTNKNCSGTRCSSFSQSSMLCSQAVDSDSGSDSIQIQIQIQVQIRQDGGVP
eukprot:488749-Pyramimonas_sp.AAC.2